MFASGLRGLEDLTVFEGFAIENYPNCELKLVKYQGQSPFGVDCAGEQSGGREQARDKIPVRERGRKLVARNG